MINTDDDKKKRKTKPSGPKPKTLKIRGDWQDAIKKSLNKKRPSKWVR